MIEYAILPHPADWTLLPWIESTSFGWRFSWLMVVILGINHEGF